MPYVSTLIRLDKDVHRLLKEKSSRERKSLSQLIRDAVAESYGALARKARRNRADRRPDWSGIIGICRSGVRDGSVHHDRYLYGPTRRKSK